MSRALALARQLADTHNLPDGDLLYLLEHRDPEAAELLRAQGIPVYGESRVAELADPI